MKSKRCKVRKLLASPSSMLNYVFWGILASALISGVWAKGQSTFVSGHGNDNVTFAINLPSSPSSDDLFYYLSGPIDYSWIAVGFGTRMKDSLMFIVYSNHDGKNVTVSPRGADGNFEPSLQHERDITLLNNSGVFHDRYVARWKCSNCRSWKGGSINTNNTAQQMIYAVGPSQVVLDTTKVDAGLRRHDRYGKFTINLDQAKGDPFAFNPNSTNDGASANGKEVDDHDIASPSHAVLMAGTFVVLFPMGSVWLKIFANVRLHWLTQTLGVLIIFIGAGVGINLSKQYNRSKHYNSAHQIIGFTILVLLLLQASLGALHHRAFKKHPHPTIMSKLHHILGPIAIGLGIVNGALGFRFASAPRHIIGYAIVIIIISLLVILASFIHHRRLRRKAAFETPAARNFHSAYVAPEFQNDIPLAHHGAPPAYSRAMGL